MYGQDGVYILLNIESHIDTLLFLGAGGALSKYPYIESDWAEYNLNFDKIILNPPPPGTILTIKLIFKFAEEIPDFNQYANMDDIGIFIDDFNLHSTNPTVHNNDNIYSLHNCITIFPNPLNSPNNVKIRFSIKNKSEITVKVFNIKGQLVQTIVNNTLEKGKYLFEWSGKDSKNRDVKSGIYFIQIKKGKEIFSKRIVVLR